MNDTAGPIATADDIRRLEAQPYEAAVPVTNMYDLFRRSADLWGDRIAITWLHTGDPEGPQTDYTYAELFRRIIQAANMYRDLGVGEEDAVALLLPNMPEAHFALWGARDRGPCLPHQQPSEPGSPGPPDRGVGLQGAGLPRPRSRPRGSSSAPCRSATDARG